MSFARFSDDCDVQVFGGDDADGHEVFVCFACRFEDDEAEAESFQTPSKKSMLAHLYAHRAAGHAVPEAVFTEIRACEDWGDP